MRSRQSGKAGTAWEARSGTFTGAVWGDQVLPFEDGAAVHEVFFAPGGRTHWHSHEGGQVLVVGAGEGYVVTRDGHATSVTAGDVVHAAPGEEHWHGAGRASFLVHTAVSLGRTEWLGEVSEDDYTRACATDR